MSALDKTQADTPLREGEPSAGKINGNGASTNGETLLEFKEVTKVFPDGTKALDKTSLSLGKAEFISLVGPSGCGKSTLLRIASNLESATSGSMNVTNKGIGYIFQDATLMPWRTVQANVELLGELYKIPKAARREKAKKALELVGLTSFASHYPGALSGGMKMRVSIARTLTREPSLFLFDEPFGALDQITRERLNEETLRLFMHQKFSGLFVTHSINEAVFLSSRVLVMSDRPGRIVAEIEVPFEYPRDSEIRYSPEFATVAAKVSEALRSSTRNLNGGNLSEDNLHGELNKSKP